ncbi:MAG TPA: glycosyltransferase [Candidatus Limnocylindria bacterium]|nr:glycosyltransferase [Candidatus Limnocylindria bacterium]
MRATTLAEPRRARIAAALVFFLAATAAAIALLLSPDSEVSRTVASIDPLLVLAGAAFALLVLRFSAAGLPLLIALVFLNLSQALVRYHDFPSLLQLLVIVLAFAAWLKRDTVPPHELLRDPVGIALFVWILWNFATTTFAADREVADARVAELTKALAIYLLVVLLVRDRKRLFQAFTALAASAAFISVLPIIQTVTGRFDWRFGGLARIKDAHIYGDVFEPRIAGPIGDPNFFAQALLLVLPLTLVLAFGTPSRLRRVALGACAAVILMAIILTYSRGAMVALAVMAIPLARVLHVRWRATAAVAAIGLASLILLPASVTERILTIEQILPSDDAPLRPDSSFEERRLLMQVAWVMFGDNTIGGVGAGNYTARYDDYVDRASSAAREYAGATDLHFPHNLYLEIAAEGGLIGLAIFGSAVAAVFGTLATSWHRFSASGDVVLKRAATAVAIGIAGFFVAALFLHLAFPRYLFLFFALATSLRNVAPRERSAARFAAAEPDAAAALVANPGTPLARRPVAVLVSRFPLITETFILREIKELERQGQPVVLVPMIEEHPAVVHAEAERWQERAIYTPFVSAAVLRSCLSALLLRPAAVLSILAWIVRETLVRPDTLAKSLALVPKSIHLATLLPKQGVTHLHAHFATHPATMALIISTLTGIPFSMTVHAHDIFVDRSLLRRKLSEANFIRSISRFNQLFLERLYPREAHGKIEVVHVGIEPDLYARETGPRPGDATARILAVAALKPYKGLVYLIRAAGELTRTRGDFRVDIIGSGPLEPRLRAEIERCGVAGRVRLCGALPQNEVAAAVRACDIFVQPSIIAADGQMEGIPVALMEAMAARKPVVSTSISGIPELVEHGVSGLLVDPANPDLLARAIRDLLEDGEMRRRFGAAGRAKVESEFALHRTTEELSQLLDRHHPRVALPDLAVAAAALDAGTWGVRRVHRRLDSTVLEAIAGAPAEREVIVKRHLSRSGESRPPALRAADESRILSALREAFRGKRHQGRTLGVPEPITLDEERAIVVTARAEGVPLDALIRRARSDAGAARELEGASAAAGRWLAEFQRTAPATDGTKVLEEIAGTARRHARLALGRIRAARVEREIANLASSLHSPVAVPHHGDFWPGNVFAARDSLVAIDFEGYRLGLPSEDVAYFLIHARLYLAFRRPEMMERVERSFLDGYGAVDPAELRLARITQALALLRKDGTGSPAQRLLRRAILRRETRG